jgi:DNA-binding CsgD family transcriptional regulator
VLELASEGITKANIARQLGIGEATIYRILAAEKVLTGKKQREAAN